jgi:hypothetical protein
MPRRKASGRLLTWATNIPHRAALPAQAPASTPAVSQVDDDASDDMQLDDTQHDDTSGEAFSKADNEAAYSNYPDDGDAFDSSDGDTVMEAEEDDDASVQSFFDQVSTSPTFAEYC